MKQVPAIPKDLLDYLRETFPNKLPTTVISADQLGILVGQQKLIDHLVHLFEKQNKTVLAPT